MFETILKECPKCKKELPLSNFYLSHKNKARCYCKLCEGTLNKEWRANNIDKVREIRRLYNMKYPLEISTGKSYSHMKGRCLNPNHIKYKFYGARGIKVCDSWLESIKNFIADMGYKPSLDYQIHRKDSDGNYCPENCEWKQKNLHIKEHCKNRKNIV